HILFVNNRETTAVVVLIAYQTGHPNQIITLNLLQGLNLINVTTAIRINLPHPLLFSYVVLLSIRMQFDHIQIQQFCQALLIVKSLLKMVAGINKINRTFRLYAAN